jgi:4-diphosphocytidyl-2-C-methyl-D-erythritol kinase
MHVRFCNTHIEVLAPAKINLFLEVLARRDDGFHDIETLMAPVNIFDSLRFTSTDDGHIRLACRWFAGARAQLSAGSATAARQWEPLPEGDDNLVVRVVRRLQQVAGIDRGAAIQVTKRIPAAAGLGGASSDAAAVLLAANRAWQVRWSRAQLAELAAEFGSDIPFFLYGTSCTCRGRGERIQPEYGLRKLDLVIVRPPVGLSTPEVYQHCQAATRPQSVHSLVTALRDGHVASLGQLVFNRLQEAARQVSPWIDRLRDIMNRQGCWGHQMSGSGSSYFGICRHARHARFVAGRLKAAGFGAVFPATTMEVALRHG